jgi:hypothetical protein
LKKFKFQKNVQLLQIQGRRKCEQTFKVGHKESSESTRNSLFSYRGSLQLIKREDVIKRKERERDLPIQLNCEMNVKH